MYKVLGREILGEKRLGRYLVEFSFKCPDENKRYYLVSSFTAFFPGRVEMRREDDSCKTVVLLREGNYPYVFIDSAWNLYLDQDNQLIIEKDKTKYSLARVGIDDVEKALREDSLLPEHVIHVERDPAYLSRFLDQVIIRIKIIRNKIRKVYLGVLRDDREILYDMEHVYRDNFFDYYEIFLQESFDKYIFYLNPRGEDKLVSFGRDGLYDAKYFEITDLRGVDTPLWWLGAIYYQIFPDSFYNYDPSNDPPEKISIDEIPRKRGYLGGDLRGIIEKIDYLRDLGIEAIYLTPIFKSPSYHRYDVVDYLSIDPYLGTISDFLDLVREARERDIRIILDVVPNHVSPCSDFFKKAIELGSGSDYWEMFRFYVKDLGSVDQDILEALKEYIYKNSCRKIPEKLQVEKLFFERFYKTPAMARWDHDNTKVTNLFREILRKWIDRGVDGFRIDVGHGLPDEFLEKMYLETKTYGGLSKVFIIELTGDSTHYPLGVISDSAMNYRLYWDTLDFFVYRNIDAYDFVAKLYEQYFYHPYHVIVSMYNFASTHDTPRIITLARDIETVKNIYAFIFIAPGSPAIYYGDEIGLEGGSDPDNRRYMIWDENKWNKDLRNYIKKLIELRKRYSILRIGRVKYVALDRDSVAVIRYIENRAVAGIFSRNIAKRTYQLDLRSMLRGSSKKLFVELDRGRRVIYLDRKHLYQLI